MTTHQPRMDLAHLDATFGGLLWAACQDGPVDLAGLKAEFLAAAQQYAAWSLEECLHQPPPLWMLRKISDGKEAAS